MLKLRAGDVARLGNEVQTTRNSDAFARLPGARRDDDSTDFLRVSGGRKAHHSVIPMLVLIDRELVLEQLADDLTRATGQRVELRSEIGLR